MNNLSSKALQGNDYLVKNNIIVDYERREIRMGRYEYTLVIPIKERLVNIDTNIQEEMDVLTVSVTDSQIPPHSQVDISVKANIEDNIPYMFHDDRMIFRAKSHKAQATVIMVTNPTNMICILQYSKRLGSVTVKHQSLNEVGK